MINAAASIFEYLGENDMLSIKVAGRVLCPESRLEPPSGQCAEPLFMQRFDWLRRDVAKERR